MHLPLAAGPGSDSLWCPLQDEPFHVDQTAQYCRGNFTAWDPKITTLPGLYLLGAPYGLAVHQALSLLRPRGLAPACGTAVLRSLNVLLAAAFFAVFNMLYRRLHPSKTPEFATLMVRTSDQLRPRGYTLKSHLLQWL